MCKGPRVASEQREATMLRTDIKGLSVAYQRTGRGPAVVLLHGFTQDSRVWIPQLADLSDRFTVIAWDAPGAGQSSDPPAGFAIGDWADTLAALLDAETISYPHVVGLSWGGLLAQELYRRYPSRISSLVLVDTYAGWVGSLANRPRSSGWRLASEIHHCRRVTSSRGIYRECSAIIRPRRFMTASPRLCQTPIQPGFV
jgi:pimeloyl-ACP methyl ester carboxylesterase